MLREDSNQTDVQRNFSDIVKARVTILIFTRIF